MIILFEAESINFFQCPGKMSFQFAKMMISGRNVLAKSLIFTV